MPEDISCIHFMDVRIDDIDYPAVSKKIGEIIRENGRAYISVNDVVSVMAAAWDHEIREAINASTLSVSDGTPLAWFGRLAGCRRLERISGRDLMENLFGDPGGYRHFLLGDTEKTIAKVKAKAAGIWPGIRIDGYSPPFREFDDEDNRIIMEKINAAAPDIIWVSLGGGRQDKWMHDHIEKLPRGVMIGVGAALRWFTGDLVTPPRFIQKMGLQWLFRIAHYLAEAPLGNLKFVVGTVLKRDMIFLLNLPREVFRARRNRRENAARTAGGQRQE